jgi:hypothetical protein
MIIVSGILFLVLMGLYWWRERRFWNALRRYHELVAAEPEPGPSASAPLHKKAA